MKRRRFLLAGVAALACLAGQAEATVPLTFVDNPGTAVPGGINVIGTTQSQSNSITLSSLFGGGGASPAPGDLALYYGVVNTSVTSSGTQGIAAGPPGWTVMLGVAQVGTTPVFITRGVWTRVLTAADIANDVVAFTPGAFATVSACGMMVYRGGTAFTLISSGGVSGTSVNTAAPTKPVGSKLMIYMLVLRADLAEVITPDPNGWQHSYPGVMFAGAIFFHDPISWVNGQAGHWQWTTTSQGQQVNVSIS